MSAAAIVALARISVSLILCPLRPVATGTERDARRPADLSIEAEREGERCVATALEVGAGREQRGVEAEPRREIEPRPHGGMPPVLGKARAAAQVDGPEAVLPPGAEVIALES